MQNILFGLIMILLTLPGTVFAASGTPGSVDTLSASVVDSYTADLRAAVVSSVAGNVLYFEYGPTPELGRRTHTKALVVGKAETARIRASFLTPNVTYYYRAAIEGTAGTVYADTRTFVSGYQNDSIYAQGQGGASVGGTNSSGSTNTGSGSTGGTSGTTGSTNVTGSTQTGAVGNALSGTIGGGNTSMGILGTQTGGQSGTAQNPGGFFQRLFDAVTRARPVQLSIAMNPAKPAAREIIEYIVTYSNSSNSSIAPGTLRIVLPDSVVYLADNSGGKTTLSKVAQGQEIAFTTDTLSAKEKRTMTIMAVAGSAAEKTAPLAVATMAYTNAQGSPQSISTNKAQSGNQLVAAAAASDTSVLSVADKTDNGGIIPNTFFEWLIFLAVVTGLIVIVRKIMATYQERKKRILEESREITPAHA